MSAKTHERWCVNHVHAESEGDLDFCKASATMHGVQVDLYQDGDGRPACEIYSGQQEQVSSEQLRQLAALFLNMADALEKAHA